MPQYRIEFTTNEGVKVLYSPLGDLVVLNALVFGALDHYAETSEVKVSVI